MTKSKYITRLKRSEGQLRGIQKMMEEERDCVDIITQLTAVRSSVDRIIELMITENLTACINDPLGDPQAQKERLEKAVKYLLDLKIPLVGGADHGYSEVIYLEDLEGNGIELYRDKPVAEWEIREDGRIIGVTEELSAQAIYELGRDIEHFVIAEGTRMGHVHLSVKNSRESSSFYQESLGLEDKFTIPHASWIASGDYHHHLAVNEWGGKNLAPRQHGMPGLAYYVIEVENKEILANLFNQAQRNKAKTRWISSSEFSITDKDGILTRVRVEG